MLTQYNNTIYDQTIGNNPWGFGLGTQIYFATKKRFMPSIELTGDVYLEDDKLLRVKRDSVSPVPYKDVRGMLNLFIGLSFNLTETFTYPFWPGQVLPVAKLHSE